MLVREPRNRLRIHLACGKDGDRYGESFGTVGKLVAIGVEGFYGCSHADCGGYNYRGEAADLQVDWSATGVAAHTLLSGRGLSLVACVG